MEKEKFDILLEEKRGKFELDGKECVKLLLIYASFVNSNGYGQSSWELM